MKIMENMLKFSFKNLITSSVIFSQYWNVLNFICPGISQNQEDLGKKLLKGNRNLKKSKKKPNCKKKPKAKIVTFGFKKAIMATLSRSEDRERKMFLI